MMRSTCGGIAGWAVALACVLTFGGVSGAQAADVSTSPAKLAAYETRTFTNLAIGSASVSAQIAKGKKKRVLSIEAAARTLLATSTPQNLGLNVVVNGVGIQPGLVNTNCPVGNTCTVSFAWIADLDQLEADNPGAFIGEPLGVTVGLSDGFSNTAQTIDVHLAVRMEKKK